MAQQYQNYIAGRWCDARAGSRFDRENPATGTPTGSYPLSIADDVRAAACAAVEAQAAWRRMPAPKRGEILFRAAEILVRKKEQFARDLTEEMGKVLKDSGLIRGTISGPRTCYCLEPRALRRLKALVGAL